MSEVNHLENMSEEKQGSFAFELLKEVIRQNKCLIKILVIVIWGWLLTIAGFLWFLNQYNFSATSTITVDGKDSPAIYQEKGEVNFDGQSNKNGN